MYEKNRNLNLKWVNRKRKGTQKGEMIDSVSIYGVKLKKEMKGASGWLKRMKF